MSYTVSIPNATTFHDIQNAAAPTARYYHTVEVGDFPLGNYMYEKYGFVNRFRLTGHSLVKKEFYRWFLDNINHKHIFTDSTSSARDKIFSGEEWYDIEEMKAVIKFTPVNKEKGLGESNFTLILFYTEYKLVEDLLKRIVGPFYAKRIYESKDNRIGLIVQSGPTLDTMEYTVKIDNIDIELNYGKKMIPVVNNIIKRLNKKNDKGIVMLHGEPGTGKTSLIKHIAKKVKKEILFVPPSMAESITSPSFIPFLMEHSDSVLVIEDAERILTSREQQGANLGVTNILNLSDGILGDCLNIQVIATFNTNLKNIDTALLRKGRLIAECEIGKLDVEHSNNLLKHIGKDHITSKPMTLAEIYNFGEEEYRTIKERQAVGFNAR
jgi:hypothetical protein